jgi:hypothetical protein
MRDDVARPKTRQHLAQVRARRDVDDQRHIRGRDRLERSFERSHDIRAARLRSEPRLHADDHVAVGLDHLDRVGDPNISEVLELARQHRCAPERPDVQEDEHLHGRLGEPMSAELGEILVAGRAGVARRGHATAEVDRRIDAPRAAFVPMAVEVHEPGAHDGSPNVFGPGVRCCARGQELGDSAISHDDVEVAVDVIGRVDDPAPSQHELRHRARSTAPDASRSSRGRCSR